MTQLLSNICDYINEKIAVNDLSDENYISTENMLPNKSGIVKASTLPNLQLTPAYQENDVLISNIRPYFRKIWQAEYCGGCSNDVLVLRAKKSVNPKFLYYVLSEDKFFDYATATSKGTKMPRGDKTAIMKYEVPEFSETEQEKIANILFPIDEKIAINSATNNNLEQQAQTIFKSWFVDFEPFGGTIPNNWRNGTFSEVIEHTINGDWGKDTLTGSNTQKVYCIRGADIPEVRIGNKGKMPYRYILPKNYQSKKLTSGDLVVEISGGSPTQSTGRIAAITEFLLNRYDEGMICTNFCKAIKPKENYNMFIYYYWLYLYQKNVFFSYENGTTGIKNLDLNGFIETEPIIIPDMDTVHKFSEMCNNFEKVIFSNGYENEQLATLRDTLLPKLMSGEIDVSNVDISTDKLYEPACESKLSAEPYNSSGSFASASKNLPSEQSSSADKLSFSCLNVLIEKTYIYKILNIINYNLLIYNKYLEFAHLLQQLILSFL